MENPTIIRSIRKKRAVDEQEGLDSDEEEVNNICVTWNNE
jgi:hypothetical protein